MGGDERLDRALHVPQPGWQLSHVHEQHRAEEVRCVVRGLELKQAVEKPQHAESDGQVAHWVGVLAPGPHRMMPVWPIE